MESALAVVGFVNVGRNTSLLPPTITQYLAPWQVLDWFPSIIVGSAVVPTDSIQRFTILCVAMPSTLVNSIVDDGINHMFFRSVILVNILLRCFFLRSFRRYGIDAVFLRCGIVAGNDFIQVGLFVRDLLLEIDRLQ